MSYIRLHFGIFIYPHLSTQKVEQTVVYEWIMLWKSDTSQARSTAGSKSSRNYQRLAVSMAPEINAHNSRFVFFCHFKFSFKGNVWHALKSRGGTAEWGCRSWDLRVELSRYEWLEPPSTFYWAIYFYISESSEQMCFPYLILLLEKGNEQALNDVQFSDNSVASNHQNWAEKGKARPKSF